VDRDETEVLEFAARHELVLSAQIRAFLGMDDGAARRAARGLIDRGYLTRVRLVPAEEMFVVSSAGCEAAGLAVMSPEVVVERGVRRAVGAVWVWIRSRDGRIPHATVLSAREQLAHDLTVTGGEVAGPAAAGRYGIRIGGLPAAAQTGLHYPDVVLQFPAARSAVQLQFTPPGSEELLARLRAYGADDRYAQLVFLVEREDVARQIETAAVSAGVGAMTLVRWMDWSPPPPADPAGSARPR
jgi:hypothetical protein